MSNLDLFNDIAGEIFSKCYENFPVPVDFYQKDFFPDENKNDPYDPFYYTLMWLQKNNYITFWDPCLPVVEFLHVQLTEKTLSILNSMPEAITSKKTLGQKLMDATNSCSKEGVLEAVRQIVSLGCSTLPSYF